MNVKLYVSNLPKSITLGELNDLFVQAGDVVRFTGPYGEFHLNEEADTEIICVGGGCGMASLPLRATTDDRGGD